MTKLVSFWSLVTVIHGYMNWLGPERKSHSSHYEIHFHSSHYEIHFHAKKQPTHNEIKLQMTTIFKNWKYQRPGEYVEQVKRSYLVDGNAERHSNCETVWQCLQRFNTDLLYGLAIPFLGVSLTANENTHVCSQKKWTLTFTAALYSSRPQHFCLHLVDSWRPVVHAYSGILLGDKKKQTTDRSNNVDESWDMPSERNQSQKATHCMIPFLWHSGKGNTVWLAEDMPSWRVLLRRGSGRKFGGWWHCYGSSLRWQSRGSICVLKFLSCTHIKSTM